MSTCPICQENITDPVTLTCEAMHEYCFKCILNNIKATGSIKSCPYCRGGSDNSIIINKKKNDDVVANNDQFKTVDNFLRYKDIIYKLNTKNNNNGCVIHTDILLTYINNEQQLKLWSLAKEYYTNENELFEIIKWKKDVIKKNNMVNVDINPPEDLLRIFLGNMLGS